MGFDISYSTTETISLALQREIMDDARKLCKQKSWIQCEGPDVRNDDGYLIGESRLTPAPTRSDAAEAREGGAPDGTVLDLLDALCRLSANHGIDWEISHDHSDGILGYIECGVADEAVRGTFDGLAAMCEGEGWYLSRDDFEE